MTSHKRFILIVLEVTVLTIGFSKSIQRGKQQEAATTEDTFKETFKIFNRREPRDMHTLTILYEALCPDSENFMAQIGPVFEELKDYIQLEFVPFGLTKLQCGFKVNGTCVDPVFRCKHGPSGCHANRLHDCALQHSVSLEQKLNFVLCTMGPHKESVDKCLYQLRYNLYDVDLCMNFDEGTNLQLKSYDKTYRYTPTTVPLILIDGEYVEEHQEKALKDFRFFICTLLTNKYSLFNKSNAPSMCRTKDVFPNLSH